MDKVGINEVQPGSGLSISLDTFRRQVNYENLKNKGYVRFVRGTAPNEVTLGKVNNFCDLFSVNWRTNVDDAHNKALREQMVNAMAPDLKFVDKTTRESILNLIRSGNIGSEHADVVVDAASTKVMARLELKALFERFDKVYNTVAGRERIVGEMLVQELEGLIPLTGNAAQNLRTALDYAENVLGVRLDLLEEPSEGAASMADAARPGRRIIPESQFRSALEHAQKVIAEAKAKRGMACDIVDAFIQDFALNGDLMDYTLPDRLKNDPERADKWGALLGNMVSDAGEYTDAAHLSASDRKLLNLPTMGVGTPTFLQMYVRDVLGYRLKAIYRDFAAKLAEPAHADLRKEIMDILTDPDGPSVRQTGRFHIALGKLLGEDGKPFQLYRAILDDAVKYSREVYNKTRQFADEKASDNPADLLKEGFGDTKMGKVFRNLKMGKEMNARIVQKLRADGAPAAKINAYLKSVKGNGIALAFDVEAYYATEEYCVREFGLSKPASYQACLEDRWAEELQRLDKATDVAYHGGGLSLFCDQAMDLVFGEVGVNRALCEAYGLAPEEVEDFKRANPSFGKALQLTTTYVMRNIGGSAELNELLKLKNGTNGIGRAAVLMTRMTMLVFHEFEASKAIISARLRQYEQQLLQLSGVPGMDREAIEKKVAAYRRACEENVLKAVRTFLDGVTLKAGDSFTDILSQGRTNRGIFERMADFLGISDFKEDVATPRLEGLVAKGLDAARAECRLEIAELRLRYAKIPRAEGEEATVFTRDFTFDALMKGVTPDFRGKAMPTLFSAEEDKARLANVLRDAVLKGEYLDAFRDKQETFFRTSLINRQGQLSLGKAAELKSEFQRKADAVNVRFNAYQDAFVTTLAGRLTEAAIAQISKRHPGADADDVRKVAERIANDLMAAGAKDIRAEILAQLEAQRAVPSFGDDDETFLGAIDKVGAKLYAQHATTALEERGKMVLSELDRPAFGADVRNVAVTRLLARSGQMAEADATRFVAAAYARLDAEIRAFPALWSLRGKDGLADLLLARFDTAEMVERITKYAEVREQFGKVTAMDETALANSLPTRIFAEICREAIEEKLVAESSTANISVARALEFVRDGVKARVAKIADELEAFANEGKAREYGLDAQVGDETVSGQLKLFVDRLLHGAGEGAEGPVDRLAQEYPIFDRLLTGGAWNHLAGEKVGRSQVTDGAEGVEETGSLRGKIFAQLLNLLLGDYVESAEKQLEGIKNGTLNASQRETVEKILDGEKNVFELESELVNGSAAKLEEYGTAILEGVALQAKEILENEVDEDGILGGLVQYVEEMALGDDFSAEEKEQILDVMRLAQRQLESERQTGESHSDLLVQLRHQIEVEVSQSDVYDRRQRAVEAAFKLGFERWAGTPMMKTVDGEEVVRDEFREDRDAIVGYRDQMRGRLVDWMRTNLRTDVAATDVRTAIAYLDVQLELKEIPAEVARTVKETVAAELTEMREQIGSRVGDEVNRSMLRALDGVKTVGGLKDKIDDILWEVANTRLATEYVPFVLQKEDEIFHRLVSDEEYLNLGFKKGVLSTVNDLYSTETREKIAEFRAHSRQVLMEAFGLAPDTNGETRSFADKVRTLAMLRISRDEVVDQVVERLRTGFKPVFVAQVRDEHAWLQRLNDAAQKWFLQTMESLLKGVRLPAIGKEGEPGYMPATSCAAWLQNMTFFDSEDERNSVVKIFSNLLRNIHAKYSVETFHDVKLTHRLPADTSGISFKKGGFGILSGDVSWEVLARATESFLGNLEGRFLSDLHAKYTGVKVTRRSDGVDYRAGNVDEGEVESFIRENDPFADGNYNAKTAESLTLEVPRGDGAHERISLAELRTAFGKLAETIAACENEQRKIVSGQLKAAAKGQ